MRGTSRRKPRLHVWLTGLLEKGSAAKTWSEFDFVPNKLFVINSLRLGHHEIVKSDL